jgi:hypothetical protein
MSASSRSTTSTTTRWHGACPSAGVRRIVACGWCRFVAAAVFVYCISAVLQQVPRSDGMAPL